MQCVYRDHQQMGQKSLGILRVVQEPKYYSVHYNAIFHFRPLRLSDDGCPICVDSEESPCLWRAPRYHIPQYPPGWSDLNSLSLTLCGQLMNFVIHPLQGMEDY
jgi:hypothetical protein